MTAWAWFLAGAAAGFLLGFAARSGLAVYWRRGRVRELVRQRATGMTNDDLAVLVRTAASLIEGIPSASGGGIRAPSGFAQPFTLHGRRYLVSVHRDEGVTDLDARRERRDLPPTS